MAPSAMTCVMNATAQQPRRPSFPAASFPKSRETEGEKEREREKYTERVGSVENGGGDEDDGEAEVLIGDVVGHVAHDEGQTHPVEQSQRHHELHLGRAAQQRKRGAQSHGLAVRKTLEWNVERVVFGGLRLVGRDAGDEHEAEEGDDGSDGEDGKENFVVHIGKHRFDQTADQSAHTTCELENGEEQTVVFACHVGKTWNQRNRETVLLAE